MSAVRAAPFLAVWLLFSGCLPLAHATEMNYGMTFTYANIDITQTQNCAQNADAAVNFPPFLLEYFNKDVRSDIKKYLKNMNSSGFSGIRTLVYFARGDNWAPYAFDVDRDGAKAATTLATYARDVFAAGFRQLFIVYLPLGMVSPSCRYSGSTPYGECFDPTTVSNSIAFVNQIRRALIRTQLEIVYDLAPEMCPVAATTDLMRSNIDKYMPPMVAEYSRAFPNDLTGVSCPVQIFPEGKIAIDEAYLTVNRTPGVYPIAVYTNSSIDIDVNTALQNAAASVDNSKTPIIVSETEYGNAPLREATIYALGSTLAGLKGVNFWPLADPSTNCSIDVAPPYTLSAALGEPE